MTAARSTDQPTDVLIAKVCKDRAARDVYRNGAGAGQPVAVALEILIRAVLKHTRDVGRARLILESSDLDLSDWSHKKLEGAIRRVSDLLDRADPTHDVLAEEFLATNPNLSFGQGSWQEYGSGHHEPLPDEAVGRRLLDTLVSAKDRGIKPSLSVHRSVMGLAKMRAHVPDGLWDHDPNVIVCKDRTLEIAEDGAHTPREHRAEDFAQSALPFDFDPGARCDVWRMFLRTALSLEEVLFFQEFAGLALTADQRHELALWLLGERGTGRSTAIEGVLTMLGDRAGRLGLREISESRFGLPPLVGKTLVYATESPSDYLRSADTLINVISGEPVFIEAKGKDVYQYRPAAKVLWAMNSLPQLRDQHSGLWRRVKVLEFVRKPENPDPAVKEAVKGEGPGILVWALEGLRRLRERGSFDVPTSVTVATEAFRESNDIAAEFVADMGIKSDPEGRCSASKFMQSYNLWRRMRGYSPISDVAASGDWKRLGFTKSRTKPGTCTACLPAGMRYTQRWSDRERCRVV